MADNYNIIPIKQLQQRFMATMQRLPAIIGNEGKNFFLDSFKNQGWLGSSFQRWPARKKSKWGINGRNRKGRALLVMSGRLRRSIRVTEANTRRIGWGTDVPYARAHNEGLRLGLIQHVRAHERKLTTVARVTSLKTRRTTSKKVVAATVMVRAHTRRIDQKLPKRQFMGESPYLTQKLARVCTAEILKTLR